uniref:Uncharacterized protein n=1 Tax=Gallus gallus TaxID=9031 RepID=A0A8V1AHC5_CHICK
MGLNEQIYTGAIEMLSRVAPSQWSLTCAVSALPFLSCHMHTGCAPGPTLQHPLPPVSPLTLPESSQSIWLMVRFCSTDISEIISLDLRRSSMCTDCHRPTDTNSDETANKAAQSPCRTASREPLHKGLTWPRRRAGHFESHLQSLPE